MLQIGSTVRVKENAYEGSDDPGDFEVRGQVGEIVDGLKDGWGVRVGDEWFVLNDDELEEIEIEENIDPDTPRNREVLAAIRHGIETLGWEEFEKTLVEALNLHLVAEGDGQRHYEDAAGQAKFTFSQWSENLMDRLALLNKLEAAIRRGVEATHYLNGMRGQLDFVKKMEIKGQQDAAWAEILLTLEEWAEILLTLEELDELSPPSAEGGEAKEQL